MGQQLRLTRLPRECICKTQEAQAQKVFYSETDRFPNQLGDWLGYGGITSGIRAVATIALFGGVAWLLLLTWRGRLGWVTAAGWATALLLVTTAWLLPWYLVWLLPLAALSPDRRLRLAALAVGAFVVYTRVNLWFELAPSG